MASYKRLLRQVDHRSLASLLPQVVRSARSAQNDEFATWARLELLGYIAGNPAMTDDTIVPEYRSIPGHWINHYGQRLIFRDPKLDFVNHIRLRAGVSELEQLAQVTSALGYEVPEFAEVLRDHLDVEAALFSFSPLSVQSVLVAIQSELSDRLMASHPIAPKRHVAPVSPAPAQDDILELKPNFYGVGINLRALWRRFRRSAS